MFVLTNIIKRKWILNLTIIFTAFLFLIVGMVGSTTKIYAESVSSNTIESKKDLITDEEIDTQSTLNITNNETQLSQHYLIMQ